jgi:protein TonB
MSNAGGQSPGPAGAPSGSGDGSESGGGAGDGGAQAASNACSEKLSKAKPKSKTPIRYPEGARAQGVEGRVLLRAHVDAEGRVTRVEVLKSPGPLLDEEVQAALKQWTFEPASRCGKPVATTFKLDRRFELEG